ncbi:peptidase M16 [Vulcanimicrobium alpinum]|uniref:Peptidase M16 n=1 Tax=Vulcanimicrobium alpinum TaxID=3016050 RepID=A0AAN2C8B4_UNVUL|nr:pitrilysin family protein [Vulcanimicrobium alpinum]BDE04828.1 peptidase M16 [Vulcanimicrobium alpinum]
MTALPTISASAIRVEPLAYVDRTLANGLRAILVPDRRVPSVAINVAYRVGGKDDPPGRSGFAHLFEHLMFKGTSRTAPETIDRLTEDVGGYNNAFTSEDITNYYEVVPSNHLERLLWAEADRLASLTVNDANFATERDVVIGEYDQRILAEPYGMLDELVNREAYRVHPYGRGVIGSPDELNAASLDDVKAFHATYYRPDNAVLVVAGDLDVDETWRWIERHFGAIATPPSPVPRVVAVEPEQTAERVYEHRAANVPLAAVEEAYHIPAAAHPDAAALDVLETILGAGRSSRLYQSLVYTQQLATSAWASADLRQQPGLFSVRLTCARGVTLEAGHAALRAELERIRDAAPSEAEMARVGTQIASALVRSRQTSSGVALALVRATTERGDPAAVNGDLDRYLAVTAADVLRVAHTYLRPENRTVIRYLPQ